MDKLKVFQTYYKEEQYENYHLDQLPEFVEVINTRTYEYPHSELNVFWSEYIFMKYVWENLDKYDCEYIGFDQYKWQFNYEKVLNEIESSPDICIISRPLTPVNIQKQYRDSHNVNDLEEMLNVLHDKQHNILVNFISYGVVPFFWGSCFIMKKQHFKQLGDVIFPVLDQLDKAYQLGYDSAKYEIHFKQDYESNKDKFKNKDNFHRTYEYQRRVFGYLAERLLSSWVIVNFIRSNKIKYIPYKPYTNNTEIQKIVILISHELGLTGAPRALYNMACTLQKQNYKVIIISPVNGPLSTEYRERNIQCLVVPNLLTKLQKQNIPVLRLFSFAEFVICNTIVTAIYAPYLSYITAKKILWIHEGAIAYDIFSNFNHKQNFKFFDKIYTVGQYSNQITRKQTGIECQNLVYYIEDKYQKVERICNNGHLNIAVIGSIEYRKGHDLIGQALSQLPKKLLNQVTVYILGRVGQKDIFTQLQKDAQKYPIKIIGEVSNETILKTLEKIDIVLCPSRDDPMPIVCTEAFMMKKPVIVSTHTGTASFVTNGKNGFIIEPTADGIASGITQAFESINDLTEIGAEGRKIYEENFTPNIFEDNIKNILKDK